MGQRYLELETSHTGNEDGTGILHVSQLPPNPAIFPPGPVLVYVVVNGVPSIGQSVMVGSGKIEDQKTLTVEKLPESQIVQAQSSPSGTGNSNSTGGKENNAMRGASIGLGGVIVLVLAHLCAEF